MLRIGLIGEGPNDTEAVKNLLLQKYSGKVSFFEMLKNIEGHQLNNSRTKSSLIIEYQNKLPNYLIFIRDTDGIYTQEEQTLKVLNWFNELNGKVHKKGILFCNIYEIEALILADLNTFNKLYKSAVKYTGNVSYQKEPKEFLIRKTRHLKKTYSENDCPSLFAKLDFDIIKGRCDYFKEFVIKFERITKLIPNN